MEVFCVATSCVDKIPAVAVGCGCTALVAENLEEWSNDWCACECYAEGGLQHAPDESGNYRVCDVAIVDSEKCSQAKDANDADTGELFSEG